MMTQPKVGRRRDVVVRNCTSAGAVMIKILFVLLTWRAPFFSPLAAALLRLLLFHQGFIADRDVEVVRRSTKGIGTNEANLVNTLCNRTKKQLDAVDLRYHKKVRGQAPLFRSVRLKCVYLPLFCGNEKMRLRPQQTRASPPIGVPLFLCVEHTPRCLLDE